MSAATADLLREITGAVLWTRKLPAAADICYRGAAICLNAAGYIAPVTATSGDVYQGIAKETVDNSAGDAGDKKVEFHFPVLANWDCSGLAQSDCGGDCWFSDDHTVTTTPGNCYAGKIIALDGSTRCWVNHLPAARTASSWTMADDAAAVFGTGSDVSVKFNAVDLEVLPATDDLCGFNVGDGTTDMDFKVFLSATTKYVVFDVGDVLLKLEDVDLHLGDNDALEFGDAAAGDVRMLWNAANLAILPKTDDIGAILIGDGTTDMDLKVFMGTTGKYVNFDNSAAIVFLEDTDLQFGDNDLATFGDASGGDVRIGWDADSLNIVPATDNTGTIEIGNGTADMDLKVFMGATTSFVLFDNNVALVQFEDTDVQFGDNDVLEFGDAAGGDVAMKFDTANLTIKPKVDNTGQIQIGDGTTDMDLLIYHNTNTKFVLFDVSEALCQFDDVDLLLGDNDELRFGDAANGDVVIKWDATGLVITGLPTSDPTHAGALWLNSNVLTLSAG